MKVEYVINSKAIKEVIWLLKFLIGLGGSTLGCTAFGTNGII